MLPQTLEEVVEKVKAGRLLFAIEGALYLDDSPSLPTLYDELSALQEQRSLEIITYDEFNDGRNAVRAEFVEAIETPLVGKLGLTPDAVAQIKYLISRAKLEQAFEVFLTGNSDLNLNKQIIALHGRYKTARSEYNFGVLENNILDAEIAKITYEFLTLLP